MVNNGGRSGLTLPSSINQKQIGPVDSNRKEERRVETFQVFAPAHHYEIGVIRFSNRRSFRKA